MILIIIVSGGFAVDYDPGDWVNYTIFKYVTSVAADHSVVYFGTTGGIIRYDFFANKWLDPLTTTDGMPSNFVEKIAYEPVYNELWVLTRAGSARYSLAFESWYLESDFPDHLVINDWQPRRFGTLFPPFGYDYMDGNIIDDHLRKFPITAAYEDEFYHLYAGTWGMGVVVIDSRHLNLELMPFGPYNYNISKVVRTEDFLWLGNDYSQYERGITRYSLKSKNWEYFEPQYTWGLGSSEITSGISLGQYTWLGTAAGLVRIDNNNSFNNYDTFSRLPSENVLSLAEYGGFIYIGTDDGLGILAASGTVPDSLFKSPLPENYRLRGQRINDLLVLKNSLYIATDNGVYMFNSDKSEFRELDTPTSDLAYGANDIFTDGKNIYFAARFGVVVVDSETDTASMATDHSLSDRWRIYQLYSDTNYIWAATSEGLWRYKKSDESTYLYTRLDGLPTDDINSLVNDGDYLWLGTRKGLIRFMWNSPGRGD
jgi:hypothetical protein